MSEPPSFARPPQDYPPPGYPPAQGYPPAAGYPAAPVGRPSPAGRLVALLGFAVMAAGLFALPLNAYDQPGGDIGFVETRSAAAVIGSRQVPGGRSIYSGLAEFWWRYGALLVAALAVVILLVLIATAAARPLGWVLAAVALAGGVVNAVAMAQSADYRTGVQQFAGSDRSNFYDAAGPGVYVSLAGFAVLAVGGVMVGLTRRG